jgi:hypothetical protein
MRALRRTAPRKPDRWSGPRRAVAANPCRAYAGDQARLATVSNAGSRVGATDGDLPEPVGEAAPVGTHFRPRRHDRTRYPVWGKPSGEADGRVVVGCDTSVQADIQPDLPVDWGL